MSLSPEIYPHAYDPSVDMVGVVRLSEAEFRNASFLDQRVLPPGREVSWAPWPALYNQVGRGRPAAGCDFIFHIGHVGSTLLSRLLGEHPAVFSLREPTPLRTLAAVEIDLDSPESLMSPERFEARLGELIGLLSRTWRPGQKALVKATSTVSALAPRLLGADPQARALMMYSAPEAFLAWMFGARNSIQDLRMTAQLRMRRLHRAIGAQPYRLYDLSPGEFVAMSWAAEMASLATAAAGREARVLTVDFERFLDAPEAALARAFAFLGAQISPAEVEALARSPIMSRYSKAPEHAYDAALRDALLNEARSAHRSEIRSGLRWLERAAQFEAVNDALVFGAHIAH